MTHAEVKEMVESIGLESAYHHFAEGESPDPPFLVFLYPNADNFAADGIVYFIVNLTSRSRLYAQTRPMKTNACLLS